MIRTERKHRDCLPRDVDCRTPFDRFASLLAAGWLLTAFLSVTSVFAQQPGAIPPPEVMRPSGGQVEKDKLQIRGFLLLDGSKNAVLIQGMKYEEFMELESGSKNQSQRFLFDHVGVVGRVEGDRAELTVEMEIKLQSTGGETIAIPLNLENFHRISPPEFFQGSTDRNNLAVTIDKDSGAYVLLASATEDTTIAFRMRMSARVVSQSGRLVAFSLPTAPSSIDLTSDVSDAVGEIPNRDDEVIQTTTDKNGRSRFLVESGGGEFILRWGTFEQRSAIALLEVDTQVAIRWNSPEDLPIQNVQMIVRDLREPITGLNLRLPEGSLLLDSVMLVSDEQVSDGQALELSNPDPEDPLLYHVAIPKGEQQTRIDLSFDLQLPGESISASNELQCRVPEVVGALRHQGSIEIISDKDYRLRWRERPFIQNVTSALPEDGSADTRTYTFRFTRDSFTLPIWLGATQRQLRVKTECELDLFDNYVGLTMEIQPTGLVTGSKLLTVDLADWEAPQIVNARTGTPLTWYESDGLIEIEMSSGGMDEIAPISLRSRYPIAQQSSGAPQDLDLAIPRVVGSTESNEPIAVQDATVRLIGRGRSSLVVDRQASVNLERTTIADGENGQRARQFIVVSPDEQSVLSGTLVRETPRLILSNSGSVVLYESNLETTVQWEMESQVDLGGRMLISVPMMSEEDTSRWAVLVNDRVAKLELVEDEPGSPAAIDDTYGVGAVAAERMRGYGANDGWVTFSLVSDELSSGVMSVRFQFEQPLDLSADAKEILAPLALPIPLVEDITLRGDIEVNLSGNANHTLVTADPASAETVQLKKLPSALIPLRIAPRLSGESELSIGEVVIRSVVADGAQMDQLSAQVSGAGDFVLDLGNMEDANVTVRVDDRPVAFQLTPQKITVPITAGEAPRSVTIQMWSSIQRDGAISFVEPLLRVRPGAKSLHWSLVVPKNRHLVWSAPSAGRAMNWVFDRWRMVRKPLVSELTAVSRLGASTNNTIPDGNQYLFTALDARSFRVVTGTRTILWVTVASLIVLVSALLCYVPATRNPLTVVVGVVLFVGLLFIAPDVSVMVGQIAMVAILLTAVMLTLRSLIRPIPTRVLTRSSSDAEKPSTRIVRIPQDSRSIAVSLKDKDAADSAQSTAGEIAS